MGRRKCGKLLFYIFFPSATQTVCHTREIKKLPEIIRVLTATDVNHNGLVTALNE